MRLVRAVGTVVVAALASWFVAAWMVVPVVRESRRRQCHEYLHQLGRALHEYHEVQGHLPAPALADRDGKPLLSWRVAILPQLGYQSLYDRFHLDEPWDSPHNRALIPQMPWELACPEGPTRQKGLTGYLVVVGPKAELGIVNTAFEPRRGPDFTEFWDGTSNTILVMETDTLVPWTKPEDLKWTQDGPLPRLANSHAGGAPVLLADGSVRFLKITLEPATLRILLTRNGGEVVSSA